MRLAQRLSNAAFNRTPEAWEWYFEDAASEVSKCRDLRAPSACHRGQAAIDRADNTELRRVVKALWQLLPRAATAQEGLRLGRTMSQRTASRATAMLVDNPFLRVG